MKSNGIAVCVLVDKLNGMGAEEIRAFFESQSVKGCMHESHNCPISNWIQKESGEYVATEDTVQVWGVDEEVLEEHKLKAGPIAFIRYFDNGHYPELTELSSDIKDDDYALMDSYEKCSYEGV